MSRSVLVLSVLVVASIGCGESAPTHGSDGGLPAPDGKSAPGPDSKSTPPGLDGLPLPGPDGATPTSDGNPLGPDQGVPQPDQGAPGPAPACDAALEKNACGGALTGKYLYKEACASPEIAAPLTAFCAGATASNVKAVSKGGSLSFTGPSYTLLSNTEVAYDLQLPASCAALSCQAAGTAASAALGAKGASSVKVSCTGAAPGGCACTVAYTVKLSKSGVLTTAGGVATLAAGEQYWYCVKGGGLLYKGKANTLDVGIAYALSR